MDNTRETSVDLKQLQEKLTDLALKLAEAANVKLDFSIESIKEVEKIASQIHKQYQKNKNQESIPGMAMELAAYIITVIENNITIGKWERDSDTIGKDTFPYYLKAGDAIFPYGWVLKRITDGEAENVWVKFETLVLDKLKNE